MSSVKSGEWVRVVVVPQAQGAEEDDRRAALKEASAAWASDERGRGLGKVSLPRVAEKVVVEVGAGMRAMPRPPL